MTGRADRVSPELHDEIIRRDGGCVVGLLRGARQIARDVGSCRAQSGDVVSAYDRRGLTIAHVRDRGKGGRTSKRPPSVRRHLVACCYGHHLADPIVDRPDVRDELDRYLEEQEGPDQDEGNRSWELIPRVRSAANRGDARSPIAGNLRNDDAPGSRSRPSSPPVGRGSEGGTE